MNDIFSNTDSQELMARYIDLIQKYANLAKELAPMLEKFGKYRQELQVITVEFLDRGIKEPESLKQLLEKDFPTKEENK